MHQSAPPPPHALNLRPAAGEPGTVRLAVRLAADRRPVVVLDDDPTGTQTSSDVPVVLDPGGGRVMRMLGSGAPALFVLTNTRAVDQATAAGLVGRVVSEVRRAGTATPPAVVLRGDSTLRGHVVAELQAASTPAARWLVCPAFPEGGRVTYDGHHWVRQRDRWVPASATEFAADPVFGYRTADLVGWITDMDPGRPARRIALADLRRSAGSAVAETLADLPAGGVALPDALTRDDVALVACGVLEAEAAGIEVTVRGAATLAGLRAGLVPRTCSPSPVDGPVLVVVGSHTELAARQLAHLRSVHRSHPVVVPTDRAIHEGAEVVAADLGPRLRAALGEQGLAVLASERTRSPAHGGLEHGAAVMAALIATVRTVAQHPAAIVTKGGITAAAVATAGLGASTAWVDGQLAPGVPLWSLDRPGGRLPHVVVPGNVGEVDTITTAVSALRPDG